MSQHTPEPWAVDYGRTIGHIKALRDVDRHKTPTVARYDMAAPTVSQAEREANARRIVACVNACKGINPDAVPSLLNACIESLARFEQDGWPLNDANVSAIKTLRDAIQKATGATP